MTDQMSSGYVTEQGDPQRLGARVTGDGINFAFAVADGAEAFLVIIDRSGGKPKKTRIPLLPEVRTGDVSAVYVRCGSGVEYYYEVDGKKVLDPYATQIKDGVCRVAGRTWDAGEDRAPGYDISDLMIYKLHVRGFTKRAKRVSARGTFAGLAEQIPYIKKLGFNAVELMPIYEFDDTLKIRPYSALHEGPAHSQVIPAVPKAAEIPVSSDSTEEKEAPEAQAVPVSADSEELTAAPAPSEAGEKSAAETPSAQSPADAAEEKPAAEPKKPVAAVPLRNYWGYAEKNYYFAPKALYASTDDPAHELREMIRAMHEAGIEVIMEMYFPADADPFMSMLAIRYWKSAYHIDGFHFVGPGTPSRSVISSPLLKGTKLIFEDLDIYGIYGGAVPKKRNLLTENDSFMHVARSFLKSDEGRAGQFIGLVRRNPATHGVINYSANVNGFTLFDTVCYNDKHNEANGENNQDGTFVNYSWNCGTEGPSKKRNIRALRARQVRNILLYTFLSQGVPLLYAGDESCNSQGGNNNAYASDDPVGWVDWNSGKDAEALRAFVEKLTAFRRAHPVFHMKSEYRGTDYRSFGCPDISLHDEKAWVCPNENSTRTIAVMYNGLYTSKEAQDADDFFYVAYNAGWEEHVFALPALPKNSRWYPAIDTHLPAGSEFAAPDAESCEDQKYFTVHPRTVVVLSGRASDKDEPQAAGKTGRGRKKVR